MAASLSAYAVITGKVMLFNQMKFRKKTLLRGDRNEVVRLMDLVIEKATEFQSELDPYGIDAADIAELQGLRDELEVHFGAPRNAIVERKTATANLDTLSREINDLLRFQLDKLMLVLKEEAPEFYSTYTNARHTVALKNARRDENPGSEPNEPYGA
jgi:hypothetical protein